jgi:hypothetical protein
MSLLSCTAIGAVVGFVAVAHENAREILDTSLFITGSVTGVVLGATFYGSNRSAKLLTAASPLIKIPVLAIITGSMIHTTYKLYKDICQT